MEFFKKVTTIDFMGLRKASAIFSGIVFIFSIAFLIINGLNWGLDFTGGVQIEVSYAEPVDMRNIRTQLVDAGYGDAIVQTYGTSRDILISMRQHARLDQGQLADKVLSALPGAQKQRVDIVGSQVGKEFATKGALAVLISLIAMMIYIALRFEYRFAVSATVALIHDPVLILGVFSLFNIEFNLIELAALLTVLGFSINDTIVVYDRIRENFRKLRKDTPYDVINRSINETLSRTIITSALTLIAVLSIYILGGKILNSSALALIIGIVIGTYSSIYVAGALALALGLSKADLLETSKGADDDRP